MLKQKTRRCSPYGSEAERNQPEGAVDPTLQCIRNKRKSIAELNDVIDRAHHVYECIDCAEQEKLRHNEVEWKQDRFYPNSGNDDLTKRKASLNSSANERSRDASDATYTEDKPDFYVRCTHAFSEYDDDDRNGRIHKIQSAG